MGRYLFAEALWITTDEAKSINHDGSAYTNPDYPKGTVIARDIHGDYFKYIGHFGGKVDPNPRLWPDKDDSGTIRLFRDYWKCVDHSPGSPYYEAIMSAPKDLIKDNK